MFHDHPITAAITDVLSVESEQETTSYPYFVKISEWTWHLFTHL